jgi:hypothetical protein
MDKVVFGGILCFALICEEKLIGGA